MGRDDESTGRQLLAGLAALAGVSLLVGAVVAAVALGALNLVGLGSASSVATQRPSLYMPSTVPTTQPEVYPPAKRLASAPAQPAPTSSAPSPSKTHKPKPNKAITLQGFPNKVSPGQRIDLTGVYQGAEGTALQVQRFEGGWTDFPVSTTVSGGIFSTYVTTSRSGVQRFRVIDHATGRHSNEVRVTVG